MESEIRSDELETMMGQDSVQNEVFHEQYSLVVSDSEKFLTEQLPPDEVARRHKIMCYLLFIQGFNQGKSWSEKISINN